MGKKWRELDGTVGRGHAHRSKALGKGEELKSGTLGLNGNHIYCKKMEHLEHGAKDRFILGAEMRPSVMYSMHYEAKALADTDRKGEGWEAEKEKQGMK